MRRGGGQEEEEGGRKGYRNWKEEADEEVEEKGGEDGRKLARVLVESVQDNEGQKDDNER